MSIYKGLLRFIKNSSLLRYLAILLLSFLLGGLIHFLANASLIIVLNIFSLSLPVSYRGFVHQIGPFVFYIATALSFFYLNRKLLKRPINDVTKDVTINR
jgi:hypothetical protein